MEKRVLIAMIVLGLAIIFWNVRYTKPLHYAVLGGHLNVARIIVSLGVDVNGLDLAGMEPLAIAVLKGNMNMIRFLVDNGANVNGNVVLAKGGGTVLMIAVGQGIVFLNLVLFTLTSCSPSKEVLNRFPF